MNEPHVPLVLFVCTGNICRSPMAEAIAQQYAREHGIAVRVASAGLAALEGHGAHELSHEALERLGIDASAHRARQLTRDMVREAALVVTATRRQRDDMRHFLPAASGKIVSFDDLTGLGELADPLGEGRAAFSRTADVLHRGMPSVFRALGEGKG